MESPIVLKTGQQEKLYPPTDVRVPLQYHLELLSAKFKSLVHSIFRNENSTTEINVSYFGVLHWQQLQPPASAPGKTQIAFLLKETLLFFFKQSYILFSEGYLFKIPKNLIASNYFFAEADTKKHRYASVKAPNTALVKLTDWIIKNDLVIKSFDHPLFFYKW